MDGRKRFVKDLSRFQSASVDGPLEDNGVIRGSLSLYKLSKALTLVSR